MTSRRKMSVGSSRATASHDKANRLAGSGRRRSIRPPQAAHTATAAQRRRPAARQQGVGQHEYGDGGRPASLTHAEPPKHPPQHDRQHHEMLSGDRQGVDDAGANEFFPFRLCHGGIFPEHQGRRRATGLRRQRVGQRPPAPAANRRRPAGERRRPAAVQPRHPLRRLRRQLAADAPVEPRRGSVGLAGIGRAVDQRQPAYGLHLVAGVQVERRPRDHHVNAAGRGDPVVAAPQGRGPQNRGGRFAGLDGTKRIGQRRRVPRLLIQHAAHLRRTRLGRGDVAHVVGRVHVAAIMVVGGAERRGRQGQKRQRQPRPSLELGDEPSEHSSQRQQQTGGKRHGRIAVQHDAGGVGQRGRHERRAPDAVVRCGRR